MRRALRIIVKDDVPISGEITIHPAGEYDRGLNGRRAMRVAPIASLVDQDMIEKSAVPIRCLAQLLGKIGKILNVVAVHLRVICYVLGFIAVMRGAVPAAIETGFRKTGARKILPEHIRGGPSQVAFKC